MTNQIKAHAPGSADLTDMKAVTDQAEITDTYALYLDDESHSFDGKAEKILFPTTVNQVAAILKEAFEQDTPVTIQGGRTGLAGGAVPLGGIILNLEKMAELLYMDHSAEDGLYSVAGQGGVLLEDLVSAVNSKSLDAIKGKGTSDQQKALDQFLSESESFTFPIDPTEMSAWLGGIVACNASGARTLKFGAVRDWVCRIQVVLMNGDILDIERGKVLAQ
ncbi:MAG: FAD-binding oxidoreductase, partial [Candidatus Thorarchaeota archaeon]